MKILKISSFLLILIFLSGCFQTTALIGPGATVATSGNLLQAGLQYGANTAVKNETGEYPLGHIKNSVQEKNKQKKLHLEFKKFLKNKVKATKKKFSFN